MLTPEIDPDTVGAGISPPPGPEAVDAVSVNPDAASVGTSPSPEATGQAIALTAEVAGPGEIVQLMKQFKGGTKLMGLTLTEGLEVVAVMVGHQKFPDAKDPSSTWENVYGSVTVEGQYVIVLVKNATKKIVAAKGAWWVNGERPASLGPAPKQAVAVPAATPTLAAPAPIPVPTPAPIFANPISITGPAVMGMTSPVTETGEDVAVLLTREDIRRLLESMTGGLRFLTHEMPGTERRLRHYHPVGSVRAGSNEVLVLLPKKDMKRLLESVSGGAPFLASEDPIVAERLRAV